MTEILSTRKVLTFLFLAAAFVVFAFPRSVHAQQKSTSAKPDALPVQELRDGSHDFDFEVGSWKIHLSRRVDRLAGSNEWVDFDGTSVTRKMWDGRANIEQFETDNAKGHVEGLTLRVYNPTTHQWSIYWAGASDPDLGQAMTPMIGEFKKDGHGEFYDTETWKGRAVIVRFLWSQITPNSAHFEQSFSADGGKTWEVNWITDQTRVAPDSAAAAAH